jgi:hypothetical protein
MGREWKSALHPFTDSCSSLALLGLEAQATFSFGSGPKLVDRQEDAYRF